MFQMMNFNFSFGDHLQATHECHVGIAKFRECELCILSSEGTLLEAMPKHHCPDDVNKRIILVAPCHYEGFLMCVQSEPFPTYGEVSFSLYPIVRFIQTMKLHWPMFIYKWKNVSPHLRPSEDTLEYIYKSIRLSELSPDPRLTTTTTTKNTYVIVKQDDTMYWAMDPNHRIFPLFLRKNKTTIADSSPELPRPQQQQNQEEIKTLLYTQFCELAHQQKQPPVPALNEIQWMGEGTTPEQETNGLTG
jgi:hypothetical protein